MFHAYELIPFAVFGTVDEPLASCGGPLLGVCFWMTFGASLIQCKRFLIDILFLYLALYICNVIFDRHSLSTFLIACRWVTHEASSLISMLSRFSFRGLKRSMYISGSIFGLQRSDTYTKMDLHGLIIRFSITLPTLASKIYLLYHYQIY